MKDAGYISMFMSTYGTLDITDKVARRWIITNEGISREEFNYSEVFANHYQYRGAVDQHNARRHSPISLETTWATKTWQHRVFAFFIAVTEVNIFLVDKMFNKQSSRKEYENFHDFRKDFAQKMIHKRYLSKDEVVVVDESRKSQRLIDGMEHVLCSLPKKRNFCMEGWYNQLRITCSSNAAGENTGYERIALALQVKCVVLTAMPSTTKTRDILISTPWSNSVYTGFDFLQHC
jgi:Transposase IS4